MPSPTCSTRGHPFGRLALIHVVLTAGDALLTVSLAGSLFFSISTTRRPRATVILYLLLTMAPFAVVAPLLGPDHRPQPRGAAGQVVASAVCRAGVCLFMADHLKSLLLYPLAFTMLVLSKVYLVTKGRSSPSSAPGRRRPAASRSGPAATRAVGPPQRLARNARLGLLASLTSLAASIPAIGVYELLGGAWVLRLDMVVFAGRHGRGPALARGPAGPSSRPRDEHRRARRASLSSPTGPTGALGRGDAHRRPGPAPPTPIPRSSWPCRPCRSCVGWWGSSPSCWRSLCTATAHAPGWYGFMLVSSVAGALVGVLIVPARGARS